MASGGEPRNWGNCTHCRYFGEHGGMDLTEAEERRCQHPELEEFELVVSGACGCNQFELAKGIEEIEPAHPPLH